MASSRLGLRGARDMFSSATMTTAMGTKIRGAVASPLVGRGSRLFASKNTSTPRDKKYENKSISPSQQLADAAMLDRVDASQMQMILPGTLILPPLSQFPREPKLFFSFLYDAMKSWARGKLQVVLMSISSKQGILKPRRFKLNNSQALLAAKAMHREMATALALGNKEALSQLCVKALSIPMLANIDARQRSRRYSWELVRYLGWRNPRIVSQMLSPIAPTRGAPLVRQVVVRIKSRQRRTLYERSDRGPWEVKPEGQQEVDLTEHIVLVSVISPKTWMQGEWRVLGSVQPTTFEEWEFEKKALQAVEQGELEKYKL